MGLMGLLFKFTVECFSFLAWPLFALGYPLCASIQAIETNSNTDTRKLITYWVCFSLILLFEHAFERLIEWLPYWPYIKLLIVGCLVTPHFEGSFYVYKHLVHPCLSMSPSIVLDSLIKLLELSKQTYLQIDGKRQAKEKENLTAFKPKSAQKQINASEITEENEVSATKQVAQMSGKITSFPMEIKEITVVGGRDVPEIPALKKIQKEWTCAVCQITTTCEANLISHLQGKPHEDACDKLKAKNLFSKNKIPSSLETATDITDKEHSKNVTKPGISAVSQGTVESEADISHLQGKQHENVCDKQEGRNQTSHAKPPVSVETDSIRVNKEASNTYKVGEDISDNQHMNNAQQKMLICSICLEICPTSTDFTVHFQGKRHTEASEKLKAKDQPLKSNTSSASAETDASHKSWTCAACNVTTTSKTDLISHFRGQRHADGLEKLKGKPNPKSSFEPWTCSICELKLNNENDLIKHLEGRQHLNAYKEFKVPKRTVKWRIRK